METRSLGCLQSDLVWDNEELVSGIFLMTFILVGVDDLEGGGAGGPHLDGSQQLDVVVLVVERHQAPLSLVLSEQLVNVVPASYSNLTHSGPER